MSWWKIFRSNKTGKVPTINDIDFDTIAVNRVDGKMFFKRMLAGIESIVEFTGAGPGLGESHLRAHQIDSIDDHPPVPEEKRGKWVHSNAVTGAIELVDLPEGLDGDSAYVYIAYASDASGTGFTLTFNEDLNYIAIFATDTEIPAPVAGDFAGLWKNYKGGPGNDGSPGQDGENAYLYIAYASDNIGTDFSLSPGSTLKYIAALSTDTEIITPEASNFTGLWQKYIGDDGGAGDLGHFCYIAWRDAPGTGFTMEPNLTLDYEAILITHTEIAEPVEADFDGCWRQRVTSTGGGGGSTHLNAFPATDKTASGITTQFTANEAQAFGDVVRINSAGKAQLAKADVIANATALAMCISETVEPDAPGQYLLIGFVRNNAWDWSVGGDIYLTIIGTTGNTLSQTSPFAADPIVEDTVVQLLGVANTADSFYFNPQLVQVELKP